MSSNSPLKTGLLEQIRGRYDEVSKNENARYFCAKHYRRLHYIIGVPSAIIAALVSSSLFFFLQSGATREQQIALASAGALSAILSGLQLFLQLSKTAEANLNCGFSLYVLRLKLEDQIAGIASNRDEELQAILAETTQRLELISKGVPEIPTWIWKRYV
jgi:hypothetical protein